MTSRLSILPAASATVELLVTALSITMLLLLPPRVERMIMTHDCQHLHLLIPLLHHHRLPLLLLPVTLCCWVPPSQFAQATAARVWASVLQPSAHLLSRPLHY